MTDFANNPDSADIDWTIIVPAYNEEKRISPTLHAIEGFIASEKMSAEVIVVDDGSQDGMVALLKRDFPKVRVLLNPGNRGKGYSVRSGILAARGKYVLFSDADLSTPIEEMIRFEKELRAGADMVIASRALKNSVIEIHQHWWREMSGRIFNFLVRTISSLPYHDTQCGFKAYQNAVAKKIAGLQKLDGWAFDVEQLHIARLLKLKVREVPVHWINSAASRVNFLRDSAHMLVDIIRIRMTRYKI